MPSADFSLSENESTQLSSGGGGAGTVRVPTSADRSAVQRTASFRLAFFISWSLDKLASRPVLGFASCNQSPSAPVNINKALVCLE